MLKSERGVTLIELIMSLAIAGLIASGIIFGHNQFRASQQFTQGADQIVQIIAAARTQAATTVGEVASTGGTSNLCSAGKLIVFTAGSSTAVVRTQRIDCFNKTHFDFIDQYNTQIPWGVNLTTNLTILLVFGAAGDIKAYTSNGALPAAGGPQAANMTAVPAAQSTAAVVGNGGSATLSIDQYGNATRVIN
ncbi:MAG TPA: prepilin-type N-terminal cleavage/methylation domain-containing protein [Candidatus Saccharimonadales bacterium]|nr:prepilin-type N-terminal cleavage/methylation domain-containing protein [Candidatus Saccharimonadales bacterium]